MEDTKDSIEEKIQAFKALIYAMETRQFDYDCMCGMIKAVWADGLIGTYALDYIECVIKEELIIKNETRVHYDAYLFRPDDMPPRVAWCKAQIKQLKTL